jgi:CubicO group peptidase (beta-lactamase class C family)
MLLWEAGAFKLDDAIAPHLDFAVASPAFPLQPITFRHLFTHSSGISDSAYDNLDFSSGDVPKLPDFLKNYLVPGGKLYGAQKNWSAARPGTTFSYSNVAVALLGYLGERMSGKPFDAFTRERIFAPLGMNDTSWRYEGVRDDKLAEPYDFAGAHFRRVPRARYPDWPAGLLCTSGRDFAKFLTSYNNAALLKPETIQIMFTPDPVVMNPQSPAVRQGLVWALAPFNDGTVAFHPGGDPGSNTLAAINITHHNAALFFANITPAKERAAFGRAVVRRVLEQAQALG